MFRETALPGVGRRVVEQILDVRTLLDKALGLSGPTPSENRSARHIEASGTRCLGHVPRRSAKRPSQGVGSLGKMVAAFTLPRGEAPDVKEIVVEVRSPFV
jgi:hypothetical protein